GSRRAWSLRSRFWFWPRLACGSLSELAKRERRDELRSRHRQRDGAAARQIDGHGAEASVERNERESAIGAHKEILRDRQSSRDDPAIAPALWPELEAVRNENDDLVCGRPPPCERDPLARDCAELEVLGV